MRMLFAVFMVILVNTGIWLSGYDYDECGHQVVGTYLFSILASVSGWMIPSAVKAFQPVQDQPQSNKP